MGTGCGITLSSKRAFVYFAAYPTPENMKTRTLILAACFLLTACESKTEAPEAAPEVQIVEVQETGKIKAAWEAEAEAYEAEAEAQVREAQAWEAENLDIDVDLIDWEYVASDRWERAARAEKVSLEPALRYVLRARSSASMARSSASHAREIAEIWRGGLRWHAKVEAYEAQAEDRSAQAWDRAAQAWREVVQVAEYEAEAWDRAAQAWRELMEAAK